jgi:hypothetical protein
MLAHRFAHLLLLLIIEEGLRFILDHQSVRLTTCFLFCPVLRIRDVYPGSLIHGKKDSGSLIPDPDPHQRI